MGERRYKKALAQTTLQIMTLKVSAEKYLRYRVIILKKYIQIIPTIKQATSVKIRRINVLTGVRMKFCTVA